LSQTFARVTDSRPAFVLSRGFTNWGPLTAGVHDDMIKNKRRTYSLHSIYTVTNISNSDAYWKYFAGFLQS